MGTRYVGRRNPWVCNSTNRPWDTVHFTQSPGLALREREEELRWPAMMGWLFGCALVIPRLGEMAWIGSKDHRILNRQFIYMARVANAKMPRLLAFARRMEIAIIKAQKPMSTTLMGSRTLFVVAGTLEYSEKEPALQCRRQYCTPDSSSLKPGSGATEGVLD